MTVVYYDVEKGKHITLKNVYSILDDSVSSKEDDEVTICFEFNDREYYRDIKKEWITSINVF